MQQAVQELFITEQQFEAFMQQLPQLDLVIATPLEVQPFPKHFDLVYKGKCIVHFDYLGNALEMHVRALIEHGNVQLQPNGDYSVTLQELRKRILRAVQSN